MKKQSINRQILKWMLIVAVIPALLLTSFYLYSYDQNFKKQKFEQLRLIADKKTNQINEYIGERIRDTLLASRSSSVIDGFNELIPQFQQSENIQPEYIKLQSLYSDKLQHFLEHGFYDIFLISPSRDIILTMKGEDDLYTNLETGVYAETELAHQVNKAFQLEEPSLSNFLYYPASKELASFIAVPVLENNQILGVVAFQLDIYKLQAVIQDNIGLGAMGESNIATIYNQRPLLLSKDDIPPSININKPPFLFGVPMQQALKGVSGYGISIDRLGKEVLTIRRYLPFLHAGFIVKETSEEALKELSLFWTLSLTLVLIILSCVVYVAYILSRSIANPIIKLTKVSSAIAQGKKEEVLVPEGVKEVARLAVSFNQMVEQLKQEKRLLEQRVEQRTTELSQKEQRLRLYREQSPIGIVEWNTHCQVVNLNKAAEQIFGYSLADIQGQNFFDFIVPESEKGQLAEVWNKLISGTSQKAKANTHKNRTKEGHIISCEWYNTALKNEAGLVIGATSLVFDITERQRIDAVLQTLAETKGHNTKTIFQLIVQQLALSHGVKYALISQLNSKSPEIAETIAVWGNGHFVDNFSYPLKGSPCEKVFMEGACSYPNHVQSLFPQDTLLADMGIVSYSGVILKSIDGSPLGIIAILDDKVLDVQPSIKQIIESLAVRAATELERKQAEEKLQFAARIYAETHEGIMLTDTNAVIVDVNPGFCTITGYSSEEVIGKNASFLSSDRQSKAFFTQMWGALKAEGTWRGEIWNRSKSGILYAELLTISALLDDNNELINYVGIFSDITLAKKQQQSLEYLAHYDVLTGLPNRTLFADRFSQAIARSKREESMLAVCFIDLDEFKPVNDTYGHDIGDQVLIEVAVRIKENLREQDTASRLGGDEFTLLLGDVHSIDQCKQAMSRVHEAIAQPYVFDEKSITIAASSGMTIYPLDNADPDTLIRHADSAMYQAKLSGRNRFHLFDAMEEQKIIKHHVQIKEIEEAFYRNEFSLYYQPKLDMKTGKIYGAEALIR